MVITCDIHRCLLTLIRARSSLNQVASLRRESGWWERGMGEGRFVEPGSCIVSKHTFGVYISLNSVPIYLD